MRIHPRIPEMTIEEQAAWDLLGECAYLIMRLPEEHPSEREEASYAIHALQNYLLARPTYRTYQKVRMENDMEGAG